MSLNQIRYQIIKSASIQRVVFEVVSMNFEIKCLLNILETAKYYLKNMFGFLFSEREHRWEALYIVKQQFR